MRKAYIFIMCIGMIALLNCTVKAQAIEKESPIIEKIENIEGTKSDLYYCNATDAYLIYSKKDGWIELTQSINSADDEN